MQISGSRYSISRSLILRLMLGGTLSFGSACSVPSDLNSLLTKPNGSNDSTLTESENGKMALKFDFGEDITVGDSSGLNSGDFIESSLQALTESFHTQATVADIAKVRLKIVNAKMKAPLQQELEREKINSGKRIVIEGLPAGPTEVTVDLLDKNGQTLANDTKLVTVVANQIRLVEFNLTLGNVTNQPNGGGTGALAISVNVKENTPLFAQLDIPRRKVKLNEDAVIRLSDIQGTGLTYRFELGDGSREKVSTNPSLTYRFGKTGKFAVRVRMEGQGKTYTTDAIVVTVEGGNVVATPSPVPTARPVASAAPATSAPAPAPVTDAAPFKWALPLDSVDSASELAMGPDGTLYVKAMWTNVQSDTHPYRLFAVTPEGKAKWSKPLSVYSNQTLGNHGLPVVGRDGSIYMTGDGGYDKTPGGVAQPILYVFAPDGTEKLRIPIEPKVGANAPLSTPAIGPDGTIYVGHLQSGELHAFAPTGQLKWKTKVGFALNRSAPVLGPEGNIYMRYSSGANLPASNIGAFKPDGTLLATSKAALFMFSDVTTDLALDSQGLLYMNRQDSSGVMLSAVNSNGTLKWSSKTRFAPGVTSPVIAPDGTIYVTGPDPSQVHKLYAFNPDGSEKWAIPTSTWAGSNVPAKTPILGKDGSLYFDMGSKMIALNADGTVRWVKEHLLSEVNLGSGSVIGTDGMVYLAGRMRGYGKILALATDSQGLAEGAWPKARKNNQNTGF